VPGFPATRKIVHHVIASERSNLVPERTLVEIAASRCALLAMTGEQNAIVSRHKTARGRNMKLGRLGVWAAMDAMDRGGRRSLRQAGRGVGLCALWLPESRGRNVLVHSSWLLANTSKLIVAPGIANIYARDPMAMVNGQRALAEQSGGRFLLGLGVSHVPSVEGLRGHVYGKPVTTMRNYLDAMAASPYGAPEPAETAHHPRRAGPADAGAVGQPCRRRASYNITPEHTARHADPRPDKLLCPEVWVLLETEATKARALGRQALANYMRLDNYLNNWRRLGFGDGDFAGGGSDRFIDAISCGATKPASAPGSRTMGRRRRPCLHPVDQPGRVTQARRQGAGPARAGLIEKEGFPSGIAAGDLTSAPLTHPEAPALTAAIARPTCCGHGKRQRKPRGCIAKPRVR